MIQKTENFDWASLEDDVAADGEFRPPVSNTAGVDEKRIKFPCQACNGTGRFTGVRRHQLRSDCFACGGKGYFLTSERDRRKAGQQRQDRKARKLLEAQAAFDEAYPDVRPFLIIATWSPFCVDLLGKLQKYGSLTESQVSAIRRVAARSAEREERWAAERKAGSATVDLSPIRTMFETAVAGGYKRPVYRAAGLVITRAPDRGRNPGALYVKDEAENYLGKILDTSYTGKPAPALAAIAADPRGEAVRYGQRTGRCSCCGRTLTNEGSIDAGIGPVCAEKWGL